MIPSCQIEALSYAADNLMQVRRGVHPRVHQRVESLDHKLGTGEAEDLAMGYGQSHGQASNSIGELKLHDGRFNRACRFISVWVPVMSTTW